jgi:hypothetical protein
MMENSLRLVFRLGASPKSMVSENPMQLADLIPYWGRRIS